MEGLCPHQSLSCCPSTWEVWEERLPLKTEAKTSKTLAFSPTVVTTWLAVFIRGCYTFFHLPLLVSTPAEAFSVTLCVPFQVQFQGVVPHLTPAQLNFISMPFPGHLFVYTVCWLNFPISLTSCSLLSHAISRLSCLIYCSWGLTGLLLYGRLP